MTTVTFDYCAQGGCGKTKLNLELKEDNKCFLSYNQHWMGSKKIEFEMSGKYQKVNDQLTIISFDTQKNKLMTCIFHLVTFPDKIIVDTDFEGTREFLHADWACDAAMLMTFTPCRGFDAILISVGDNKMLGSERSFHLTKVE